MLPKSTSRTRLRIVSPAAINNAKTMGVNNLIAGSSSRVWWPEVISHDNTEECRAFCLEHAEQSFILETGLSLLPECTTERQFHDKTTALYSYIYTYIYIAFFPFNLVTGSYRKEILYLSPLLLQICHMFYYCKSSYPNKTAAETPWIGVDSIIPPFSRAKKNIWKHLESIGRIHKMCSLLVLEQLCPFYPVFQRGTGRYDVVGRSHPWRLSIAPSTGTWDNQVHSIATAQKDNFLRLVDWWNMSRARRSQNEE